MRTILPQKAICAGGVVFKDERIVSLRRKNGVWLMPKGHVEPGETLEQAAVREVREETGLVARVGAPLGETEYSFTEDGTLYRKKVFWFFMEAIGGELQPEKEMFTDIRLLSAEELSLLSFEADRKLAAKAFTRYRKKRLRQGNPDGCRRED
ncbi:MAG: NUDIX domain-containing protein [Firmicutes bacterium]|nr:NUDIX domain-containing protein [Bacillota bacterium]